PGAGQVRDRRVSLPRAARSRPHHHRRKTNPTTHRQDLAVGRRHRRRLAPNTHRLRLTAEPLPPRPEGPGTRTPGATVGHQTCPAAKISAESLNVSVQQLHSPRHERPRLVRGGSASSGERTPAPPTFSTCV